MKNFKEWLNESTSIKNFSLFDNYSLLELKELSAKRYSESESMIDDFYDHEDLKFSDGLEVIATSGSTTKKPIIVQDIKSENFNQSKIVSWEVKSKEIVDFVKDMGLVEFIFGDFEEFREDINSFLMSSERHFFEIEPSDKLIKFASSWGFKPYIIATGTSAEKTLSGKPEYPSNWTLVFTVFVYDEEIAKNNKGVISGRKYGLS